MMNINNFGTLYIVATPLGNLQDMTLRAIETLKNVDSIAAEDTRHSIPLLKHYGVIKPLISLHEHNEQERVEYLISELRAGKAIALISDAGTPLISDPGFLLVKKAREVGVKIVPIPGACAAIAALCASGLPTDQFIFLGFLSAKSTARLKQLEQIKYEHRTMIFYESPHRITDFFQDLLTIFEAEREVVFVRELTKLFETIRSGSLKDISEWVLNDENQQRGEIVILLAGTTKMHSPESISIDLILTELLKHLPLKKAVEAAVNITGQKKNSIYDRALRLTRGQV